jgi:hypothetical protein
MTHVLYKVENGWIHTDSTDCIFNRDGLLRCLVFKSLKEFCDYFEKLKRENTKAKKGKT